MTVHVPSEVAGEIYRSTESEVANICTDGAIKSMQSIVQSGVGQSQNNEMGRVFTLFVLV